jgi:hypothetical protein
MTTTSLAPQSPMELGTASIRLPSQNQWKRSSTSTMPQRVMCALEPHRQHHHRVLQLEENLKEQLRRKKRAQEAQQQRHPTPAPRAAVAFTNNSLPFGGSGSTFTDNGFSAGSTSQFLPPSQQGTTFEAASTTNPFGDTTIGTSAFGEPTGTGPAGFSFGATAGAAGFSFGASAPARTQLEHNTGL